MHRILSFFLRKNATNVIYRRGDRRPYKAVECDHNEYKQIRPQPHDHTPVGLEWDDSPEADCFVTRHCYGSSTPCPCSKGPLETVPVDILYSIASFLSTGSIAHFARTNQVYNCIFTRILYRQRARRSGIELGVAVWHALRMGTPESFDNVRRYQKTPAPTLDISFFPDTTQRVIRNIWKTSLEDILYIADPDHPDAGPLNEYLRPEFRRMFHIAIYWPHLLEYLLKKIHIDPRFCDWQGHSALFTAIKSGNPRSVWLICAYTRSSYQPPSTHDSCDLRNYGETIIGVSDTVDISRFRCDCHMREIIYCKLRCARWGCDFREHGRYKILTWTELHTRAARQAIQHNNEYSELKKLVRIMDLEERCWTVMRRIDQTLEAVGKPEKQRWWHKKERWETPLSELPQWKEELAALYKGHFDVPPTGERVEKELYLWKIAGLSDADGDATNTKASRVRVRACTR